MNVLHDIVLQEVARRGRVTFAEFMQWALYHPLYGYYTAGPDRLGREGDYFTSVHAGPLFGRLLAESFCEMWDFLGSERFCLLELGGADGRLAEQILKAFEEKGRQKALTYYLVEQGAGREAARRRLSRFSRVRILENLSALEHIPGIEGCVFSNEFFDALPFHRVVWEDSSLKELCVHARDGILEERPETLSTPRLGRYLQEQGIVLVEGQKAEICLETDRIVEEVARVLARGFVLTVDYGEPSQDLYRETRTNGTLQVYEKHKQESSAFENIGSRDITAFADFGRIAESGRRHGLTPLVFSDQGSFLLHSADTLLRDLVENEVGKMHNLSVAGQIQQLIHPQTLGSRFHVLVQGKNVGQPELKGGRANRLARLRIDKSDVTESLNV